MKAKDIKTGSTYRGRRYKIGTSIRTGEYTKRKVLGFSPVRSHMKGIVQWAVDWEPVDYIPRGKFRCMLVTSFANWAEERVT